MTHSLTFVFCTRICSSSMKSLKDLLVPRDSVFDRSRRDVVLDLTDLVGETPVDGDAFFAENYITQGMRQLYEGVFKRLEGASGQDGVFRLTQSMGGGKTHNMFAIGLLAKYAEHRQPVMGSHYETSFKGAAELVAFSGRERPEIGIWGFIAEQLGQRDAFNACYQPLQAPGQSEWVKLLKGRKLVILLDELPPYLKSSTSLSVGSSNLADVTTTSLTNLIAALGKPGCEQVAMVISDLGATGADGSDYSCTALNNLRAELNRLARDFQPVAQTGNELYHILRKRLFESLPGEDDVEKVAAAYGDEIRKAKQMDITTDTPEGMKSAVKESYPFHPELKDLYARFKENTGFQQTRGIIRLMRTVVSRMFDDTAGWADQSFLIAPYDLDLSDPDLLTELDSINAKLSNAISHDIHSDGGDAVAQALDQQLGGNLTAKLAKLILVSSLANVQNAVRGLKDTEIVSAIAAPGVDVSGLKKDNLSQLKSQAWYLHQDTQGRFLFKDVQNVVAKLNDYMRGYNEESRTKEIRAKLEELFKPDVGNVYKKVYALPSLDDIELSSDHVSLIIYQPNPHGLHPDLERLFDSTPYQNRILLLTGDSFSMDNIRSNASGLKAVEAILGEFRSESMPANDPQFIQAEQLKEEYAFKFRQAVIETFVKVYYPTKNGLQDASLRFNFQNNQLNGEEQIRKELEDKRKFVEDTTSETFRKLIEQRLFTTKEERWIEVKKRAASKTDFVWHKPGALDQVKEKQIREGQWRANGDYVEKGPFPPPPTSVSIQLVQRDPETGEVTLKVTPRNGDKVHYEYGKTVSESCDTVNLVETFSTTEMHVAFLCADSTGQAETGEPLVWSNEVTVKFQARDQGGRKALELKAAPEGATIHYSTDGSSPLENGGIYDGPFEIQPGMVVQWQAEKDGIKSELVTKRIPKQDTPWEVDRTKPATWKKREQLDGSSAVYGFLDQMDKHAQNLQAVSLTIDGEREAFMEITTDRARSMTVDQVRKLISLLKDEFMPDGDVNLQVERIQFESGQQVVDWVREANRNLTEDDVEQ